MRHDLDAPCWEWPNRRPNGYGRVWVGGSYQSAHRRAYEAFHGPIPEGMVVMHLCDNPPCVNPHHLQAGTQSENLKASAAHAEAARRNGRRPKRRVP